MSTGPLPEVQRQLIDAADALGAAAGPAAGDTELLTVLTFCEGMTRRLDRIAVTTVASLERRGAFAERGYKSTVGALGDLLGWERFEARRRVVAAEQVHPRTGLDGAELPARLPATGAAFAAGRVGLRHVEVIAAVLGSGAAGRLDPDTWSAAEERLAEQASEYTPSQLRSWGTELVDKLDQDGPQPDERPAPSVNELSLIRHRDRPGGTIKGRFDDAALFDQIVTAVDAGAKPTGSDDLRGPARRQAEALAEVCGYALDHGPTTLAPATGGRRPVLNVLVRLEDLEQRARGALLDFGGALTPASLRMLCCDAAVVPIVLGGAGQPLDVGRVTRTIPDGLRRAVAARDGGCAYPGCGRGPSWCECHHIVAWEHHGPTCLDNLVMTCKQHHRLIHHSDWTVRIRDGFPEFVPPRWIDPDQTPRRKPIPHLIA